MSWPTLFGMVDPDGRDCFSYPDPKKVIPKFIEYMGKSWEELRKMGYKVMQPVPNSLDYIEYDPDSMDGTPIPIKRHVYQVHR
jgi:hypothetical protein